MRDATRDGRCLETAPPASPSSRRPEPTLAGAQPISARSRYRPPQPVPDVDGAAATQPSNSWPSQDAALDVIPEANLSLSWTKGLIYGYFEKVL